MKYKTTDTNVTSYFFCRYLNIFIFIHQKSPSWLLRHEGIANRRESVIKNQSSIIR